MSEESVGAEREGDIEAASDVDAGKALSGDAGNGEAFAIERDCARKDIGGSIEFA